MSSVMRSYADKDWGIQASDLDPTEREFIDEDLIDKTKEAEPIAFADFARRKESASRSRKKDENVSEKDSDDGQGQGGQRKRKRRNSMDVDAEWKLNNEMQTMALGVNLELWWSHSERPTRLNTIMVLLLLVIGLIYLFLGIHFIVKHIRQHVKTPYICQTEECRKASQWLTSFINSSEDPCENFYGYICGHYHQETALETEGKMFSSLIHLPGYKVEFGENSVLAKILKNYQDRSSYDHSIRFYQACLNEPNRKKFGLDALFDTVENIFGSRNLSEFKNISLEQIGANMLRYTGDGTFINLAFYTYPYIAVLRPSEKIHKTFSRFGVGDQNEVLIQRIFHHLLPQLGITGDDQINEAYQGVKLFSRIETEIKGNLREFSMSKDDFLNPPPEFVRLTKLHLGGYCPPFGIHLNMREVIRLFVQEDFRFYFYDLMALKYFLAYEICFKEEPSKFTTYKPLNPRLAFVGPWIYGLFWDFLLSADTISIMREWQILPTDLEFNELVLEMYHEATYHIELRCMLALCKTLGYVPAVRYLTSTIANPLDFLQDKKNLIRQLFAETRKWFARIPPSEIDKNWQVMGKLVFGRGLNVDVVMPLMSGTLDTDVVMDGLNFTEDHLRNTLVATHFTVERAKKMWCASTNTEPTVKWWGSGEPWDMQYELFDIRQALIKAAEFEEVEMAGNHEKWYKFLGRPIPNYVLLLISAFDEPHVSEALSLQASGVTAKLVRTFYTLILDTVTRDRYTSLNDDWRKLLFYSEPQDSLDTPCVVFYRPLTDYNKSVLVEVLPDDFGEAGMSTGKYNSEYYEHFFSVLAVKQTIQWLRQRRKQFSRIPYNWTESSEDKKLRLQRFLPGKGLEQLSEEQLFFMSYVRSTCRGNWRIHDDELIKQRFHLELTVNSMLAQMREFQEVWKCKRTALLSNRAFPRCLR